jgi:hypothetical protein
MGKALHSFYAMVVFELPGDVVSVILSTWIDIQALAKLDTAACACKSREQYLGLIGDKSFIVDTLCTSPDAGYIWQLQWLTQRRIKVRNCIVDGEVVESHSPHLLTFATGPHVRSLQLRGLSVPGSASVFSTLAAACSGLRVLKMEDCDDWDMVSTLGASVQQSLQNLTIAYCTGRPWESEARFPNLQTLHVRYLNKTDVMQSVICLLKAAPNLTDLRLSSFTYCPINDEGMLILSNHAAGLATLELDIQHQEFTPVAVVSLAERCCNLKTLALLCGNGVNSAAVEAFAVSCLQLEGLQLWGSVTAVSVSAVAMHCGSRLRYLIVDMNYSTPESLTVIAEHCRLLEELQLCNCGFIADDAMIQLISSLPRLRELVLVNSGTVTDEVLIAIATHLPNLQCLSLRGCGGTYTEAGAQAVVTSLTQLQRFCLITTGTTAFTPALLRRWREASPGLEICEGYPVSMRYFEHMCW